MGLHSNLLTVQEVQILLQDVIDKENITDADIEIDSGAGKGDGYLSSMNKIKVSGNGKTLYLIIKSAPQSDKFREMMSVAKVYSREIFFYDTVYPIFKTFQNEHNVEQPFDAVAHCYKTQSKEFNECLVLENIKDTKGYELWDKKVQMDELHVSAVLKLYGKFHAISFSLLDQQPKLFNELTSDMGDFMMEFGDSLIDDSIEHVKKIFSKNEKIVFDALDRLKESAKDFFFKVANQKAKYTVIGHGDCWCNNMMFKYHKKGTKKISDIKLLDFQLMCNCSPVMDLSYFLYCSAGKNIYNNLDKYINIYYESLSNQMTALGSNPNKMYPLDALKNDWKEYSKFGYLMACMTIKTMLMEEDEVMDLNDIAENGITMTDAFHCKIKNEEIASQRLRDVTEHFIVNKFF